MWLLCRERAVRIGWKLPAALAGVAVLLLVGRAGDRGAGDVLGRASKSFGYRLQYWQSSLQMIADHPLVGCGPGNFQNAYTAVQAARGQRGGGRSAQFPAGDLGHGRHARHAGVSGRAGLFCLGKIQRRAAGHEKRVVCDDPFSRDPKGSAAGPPIPPPTPGGMCSPAGCSGFCCRCRWDG